MIIDKMTPYLSIIPIERMCTVTVIVCIRYIIARPHNATLLLALASGVH